MFSEEHLGNIRKQKYNIMKALKENRHINEYLSTFRESPENVRNYEQLLEVHENQKSRKNTRTA